MKTRFIWCDLSALRPELAAQFYTRVFGWQFDDASSAYRYAYNENAPVASIFDMPPFFRKINMPSFWMSYICVESIDTVVKLAVQFGGKVELQDGFDDGRVALIRDPLGAGFTVFEGRMENGITGWSRGGLRAGHTLNISSLNAVKGFYETLFGWTFRPASDRCWDVTGTDGGIIADCIESSDEERGGFEYWGITFTVKSLDNARRAIEKCGGTVFSVKYYRGHPALSVADMDGAAFSVVSTGNK